MQLNNAKRDNRLPTTNMEGSGNPPADGQAMPVAGRQAGTHDGCRAKTPDSRRGATAASGQPTTEPKICDSALATGGTSAHPPAAALENFLAHAVAPPRTLQLTDLPADLLPAILHHLGADDLQDARLACKALAQAGSDRRLPAFHEALETRMRCAASHADMLSLLEAAATDGTLQHVEWLDLSGLHVTGEHLEQVCAVFAGLETSKLVWLDLSENQITAAGIRALARTPCLAGLQHLDLGDNSLHDEGAEELAGGGFTALRHLSLRGNGIEAGGLQALTKAATWAALTYLDMSNNCLGPEGGQALGESEHSLMEHLDVGGCQLTDAGVRALMRGAPFKSLKHLDLSFNDLGAVSAEALGTNPQLRGLRYLSLRCNPRLGAGGIERLMKQHFADLEHLNLSCIGLKKSGIQALTESQSTRGVLHLDLGQNSLDDADGTRLAQASQFSKVRYLNLSGGSIGHQTVSSLLKLGHFAALEELDLSWHSIAVEDVKAMLQGQHFPAMRLFNLRMNRPDLAGMEELELIGLMRGCIVRL